MYYMGGKKMRNPLNQYSYKLQKISYERQVTRDELQETSNEGLYEGFTRYELQKQKSVSQSTFHHRLTQIIIDKSVIS